MDWRAVCNSQLPGDFFLANQETIDVCLSARPYMITLKRISLKSRKRKSKERRPSSESSAHL